MKNIHVIPTNKPSRLHKYVFDGFALSKEALNWKEAKNIYITSDEEIKVGDWFAVELFKITGESRGLHIEKCIKLNDIWCNDFDVVSTRHKGNCNKIILTTDQNLIKDGVQAIDDDFLEWFVKNPSCERVEIVFNNRGITGGEKILKTFGDYKIIIPKEEPKQETLEEVSEMHFEWTKDDETLTCKDHFISGAKWQQERMYSEEKIDKILQKLEEIKIMINIR